MSGNATLHRASKAQAIQGSLGSLSPPKLNFDTQKRYLQQSGPVVSKASSLNGG